MFFLVYGVDPPGVVEFRISEFFRMRTGNMPEIYVMIPAVTDNLGQDLGFL